MSFMKRNPFLVFGIVLVVLGALLLIVSMFQPAVSDRAGDVSDITYAYEGDMRFEIADTPEKQALGLSGRASIPDHYGMLFVFDAPKVQGFWMKDMLTSIDIIWLSDKGEILGIEHSVSPDTYPDVLESPAPVSYVLETRAGYASTRGWKSGDSILLPNLK